MQPKGDALLVAAAGGAERLEDEDSVAAWCLAAPGGREAACSDSHQLWGHSTLAMGLLCAPSISALLLTRQAQAGHGFPLPSPVAPHFSSRAFWFHGPTSPGQAVIGVPTVVDIDLTRADKTLRTGLKKENKITIEIFCIYLLI